MSVLSFWKEVEIFSFSVCGDKTSSLTFSEIFCYTIGKYRASWLLLFNKCLLVPVGGDNVVY